MISNETLKQETLDAKTNKGCRSMILCEISCMLYLIKLVRVSRWSVVQTWSRDTLFVSHVCVLLISISGLGISCIEDIYVEEDLHVLRWFQ